jgi:hypothetical protein
VGVVSSIPVWQDDFAGQVFRLNSPTLIIVHIHSHDMRDQLSQGCTVQASQCQGTSNDGVLISFRQVGTRDYDFPKEHRRVGTVLARLCLSSLLITSLYPGGSYDVDVVIQGSGVFGELDVARHDVGIALDSIDRAIFVSGYVGGSVFGQEVD